MAPHPLTLLPVWGGVYALSGCMCDGFNHSYDGHEATGLPKCTEKAVHPPMRFPQDAGSAGAGCMVTSSSAESAIMGGHLLVLPAAVPARLAANGQHQATPTSSTGGLWRTAALVNIWLQLHEGPQVRTALLSPSQISGPQVPRKSC